MPQQKAQMSSLSSAFGALNFSKKLRFFSSPKINLIFLQTAIARLASQVAIGLLK